MTTTRVPALPLAATRQLRPDERRSLVVFFVFTLIGMGILLGPALLRGDADLLRALTPVGMLVPGAAALLASRAVNDGLALRHRLALVPFRPVRRQVKQLSLVFVTMVGVAVATLVLGHLIGVVTIDLAELSGFRSDNPTMPLEEARHQFWLTGASLPLFALAYMLLTFGEEIGWRGFAQTMLAPVGFWPASFAIAAFWGLWHVPMLVTYAHLGEAPWWEAPMVLVNLTLAGMFLSALRKLTGTVWSVVFGHAVLNTAFVFIYSGPILAGSQEQVADRLGFAAVGWLVWVAMLIIIARLLRRRVDGPAAHRRS